MARPRKWRNVCDLPQRNRFGPIGAPVDLEDRIVMTVDEYEAIRLIDMEGFSQEECAGQMKVARTTVQGIYAEARKKLAQALVEGKILLIEGGEYRLCRDRGQVCGPGCRMPGPRRDGSGGGRGQGLGQGQGQRPRDGRGGRFREVEDENSYTRGKQEEGDQDK